MVEKGGWGRGWANTAHLGGRQVGPGTCPRGALVLTKNTYQVAAWGERI